MVIYRGIILAVCLLLVAGTALCAPKEELPIDLASLGGCSFQINVKVSNKAQSYGFEAKKLETKLRSILYRHGIAPKEDETSYLCLSLSMMKPKDAELVAWLCSLKFQQPVARFKPAFWTGHAPTWNRESYGFVGLEKVSSIDKLIKEFATEFAVDYLRANTHFIDNVEVSPPASGEGIVWTDTPTHKIKSKFKGGKLVKEWKFKKGKK